VKGQKVICFVTLLVRSNGLPDPFSEFSRLGFSGHVTSVTGRGHVKAMINLFGRLTPCEFEARDLAAAL
jgi:hypothetical protein